MTLCGGWNRRKVSFISARVSYYCEDMKDSEEFLKIGPIFSFIIQSDFAIGFIRCIYSWARKFRVGTFRVCWYDFMVVHRKHVQWGSHGVCFACRRAGEGTGGRAVDLLRWRRLDLEGSERRKLAPLAQRQDFGVRDCLSEEIKAITNHRFFINDK